MKKRLLAVALALVLIFALLPTGASAAETDYTAYADTLHALHLFAGSNKGYELDRSATRVETAVMTVKILGKEQDAQSAQLKHPFTDVPAWADCYVGYLYAKKITSGVSATAFGSQQLSSPAQYATFMLRALGYSGFDWKTSVGEMVKQGILTSAEAGQYGKAGALSRGNMVALTRATLLGKRMGSAYTQLNTLYSRVFDFEALTAAARLDSGVARAGVLHGLARPSTLSYDAEGVFAKASPAIFYIQLQDKYAYDEEDYYSGSGFFITSDGVAVTNYHVIEDMYTAFVRTSDGKEYPVERVLGYSEELDIAVIKVKGSSLPTLNLGDSHALRAAQRIYCIGSPLGFENTISEGLVSSPVRRYPQADDRELVQVSAAISNGSSGGAVLNSHGDVVGITTMSATFGQNLNFAVPVNALSELHYMNPPKTLSALVDEADWIWPSWYDLDTEREPNDGLPPEEDDAPVVVDPDGDEGIGGSPNSPAIPGEPGEPGSTASPTGADGADPANPEDLEDPANPDEPEGPYYWPPEQSIYSETEYQCTLSDDSDVDLYGLTMEQGGSLFLTLHAPEEYVGSLSVDLVDLHTGETVLRSRAVEDCPYIYIRDYLPEGEDYALRVTLDGEDATLIDMPYEFAFEILVSEGFLVDEPMFEIEDNGDLESAQYLPFGSAVEGTLTDAQDMDYYRFVVEKTCPASWVVLVDLSYYYISRSVEAKIYNAKTDKFVADAQLLDLYSSDMPKEISLPAGSYYIVVRGTGEIDQWSYGLVVSPVVEMDAVDEYDY